MRLLRDMTNTSPKLKWKICLCEIKAYIGLEIGMSFVRLGRIADYWSTTPFLRQPCIPRVMSRNIFQNIRASLKLNYEGDVDEMINLHDPLWTIRAMINRFQKRSHDISVPKHASTLDENAVRTKVHTTAKCYNVNKPDKLYVRFYCIVDGKTLY